MSEKKKKEERKRASSVIQKNNSTVLHTDTVLVIGGGASGMMAAITAAKEGARVTLLEHNDKNGRKINATGNGKCNFTNLNWHDTDLRGEHPEFADSVLKQFSVQDTIKFFERIGIIPLNKNGYLYPKSGQASSVTNLMTMEAKSLGVKMKTREHVVSIKKIQGLNETGKEDEFWQVLTEGWHYEAKRVILACGSCASQIPGADGSGYKLAESLGHRIIAPFPALTGLRLKDPGKIFSKWTGVRTEGKISVLINGNEVISSEGELQLTEYGISGIPVFQISRYAAKALNEKKSVKVFLDFFPDKTENELQEILKERREYCPYKTHQELLLGWIPEKLIPALFELPEWRSSMKRLEFSVKESLPFSNAQVAAGGVSTDEIHPDTLESLIQKGIYFCGELIDIDGTCGGYNLQWAWSSGAVAGKHAAGKDSK